MRAKSFYGRVRTLVKRHEMTVNAEDRKAAFRAAVQGGNESCELRLLNVLKFIDKEEEVRFRPFAGPSQSAGNKFVNPLLDSRHEVYRGISEITNAR